MPRSGPSSEKFLLDFQLLGLLCRVIRRERIDIIHAHNYEGALVGVMAKWLTRRPLLYNAVNLMTDELAGYGFIRPAWLAHGLARGLDWFTPIFPNHIRLFHPNLELGSSTTAFPPPRWTWFRQVSNRSCLIIPSRKSFAKDISSMAARSSCTRES